MLLRSQPITWAASSNFTSPLNFLDAARGMRAPVIKNFALRLSLVYSTGTSAGPARLLPQTLTRIRITDQSKERVNLRGSSLRVVNQIEFGAAYQDGVNTTASQAGVSQDIVLNIPFNNWKSRRRNDYNIPLFEFVDGGQLEINTGSGVLVSALFTTITSGTMQWFVDVDETRTRELKSRLCYKDTDITQTEFVVPIGGALRWFDYYAGENGEGVQTPLPAQNFTSQTLEYSIIPREVLRNQYRKEQISAFRTANAEATTAAEDVHQTMQAILIMMVDADAKIPEMPQLVSLHVQTDGAVPSTIPKYIFSYISDRDPNLSARTANANSPAELQAAITKSGVIKTANGKTSPVGGWSPDAARTMPVKLRL
jgi:hypothetical protein